MKEAAKRDVGTGPGQIPDMGAFTSGSGWVKFPDGTIIQTGYPAWANIPPPTHEQQIADCRLQIADCRLQIADCRLQIAENDKQSRIADANSFMNKKQWPGKVALGRIKGDELAQYNA